MDLLFNPFQFLIFVVWSTLIVGGWVVVKQGRRSCLGPAENTCSCVPGFIQAYYFG